MNYGESIVFYLVIGLAVSIAYAVSDHTENSPIGRPVAKVLTLVAAFVFWPLYLPLLLSRPKSDTSTNQTTTAPRDVLSRAIEQVEAELNEALVGLDGWAEGVLREKPDWLRELRAALIAQAERIRDMDALVARESADVERDDPFAVVGDNATAATERCQRSQEARRTNLSRLDHLRHRARGDLLATLAWIRELVSMVHLAKFTGAPAARAEELVAQIAAAVESIATLSSPADSSPEHVMISDVSTINPLAFTTMARGG